MKTIPPPCPEPAIGPKYWRSLDQLAETPEFKEWVEREFPAGASELTDPVTRRSFVKIMSASFLLAGFGLTGCRKPEEHIHPFSKMPEGYVHGVAKFYATSRPTRTGAVPLLARSNDGRPTKIEGNPNHPDSNGGTDSYSQASLLDLYDPDRATRFRRSGGAEKREVALDALSQLGQQFSATGGQGLAFLMERGNSPSRDRLQALIRQRLPQARWFVHEPVDFQVGTTAASLAFGQPVRSQVKLEAARVIVALDSDFLGAEEDSHRSIRGFAQGRRIVKPDDSMNRLYAVEGLLTITGATADHRLRVPTSAVPKVAARLAAEVLRLAGTNLGNELSAAIQTLGANAPVSDQWVAECAKDLVANKGRSIVLAGHRQPLSVHLLAATINVALENVGTTLTFQPSPAASEGTIQELAQALASDSVNTLIILGSNPVYSAPSDLNWAATQRRAKTVVRLGYYEDETAQVSDWHLPKAHFLESWGDARSSDGTLVSVQPLIEPLFGGVTEIEVLARIAGLGAATPYEVVQATFMAIAGAANADAWKTFLHDGFLPNSVTPAVNVRLNAAAVAGAISLQAPAAAPAKDSLEVVFHRDYSLDDGRYNNNGWLQELPDPITKIVWDNVILLSRKTASEHGINSRDVVEVEIGGRRVTGPAWIQPGLADYSLGLALGYGRDHSGRVGGFGGEKVGFNAYSLRTTTGEHFAVGAKITKTGQVYPIACTQDHGMMEGRPIIREANLDQFHAKPDFAQNMDLEAHAPNAGPIYVHPYLKHGNGAKQQSELRDDRRQILKSDVHQWGMSIDLTSCVGCSACVLACQSENNIPIVGKDQTARGREMHWLRIDRYFSSSADNHEEIPDDPQVNTQPMLCQHCENAPCESVCPVNATVHDEEGLNVMAYNRCVGTRYCSNNCPYKVRRFNFFDYNKRPLTALYQGPLGRRPSDEVELVKMVKNPDVTVRMRGVMEKCTFCVQRIEGAKIAQKVKAGPSCTWT